MWFWRDSGYRFCWLPFFNSFSRASLCFRRAWNKPHVLEGSQYWLLQQSHSKACENICHERQFPTTVISISWASDGLEHEIYMFNLVFKIAKCQRCARGTYRGNGASCSPGVLFEGCMQTPCRQMPANCLIKTWQQLRLLRLKNLGVASSRTVRFVAAISTAPEVSKSSERIGELTIEKQVMDGGYGAEWHRPGAAFSKALGSAFSKILRAALLRRGLGEQGTTTKGKRMIPVFCCADTSTLPSR